MLPAAIEHGDHNKSLPFGGPAEIVLFFPLACLARALCPCNSPLKNHFRARGENIFLVVIVLLLLTNRECFKSKGCVPLGRFKTLAGPRHVFRRHISTGPAGRRLLNSQLFNESCPCKALPQT